MRTKKGTVGQEKRTFIETARREQIVEAAIRTIAELGFAKSSLAQIARRAGISKGVISYHFSGKDELIEEIVTGMFAESAAQVGPRLEAEKTAASKLRAYIETNVAGMAGYRQHVQAIVEIFINFRTSDGQLRYNIAEDASALATLEGILRQGQANGEFRSFSTRVMAVAVQSAIDGAAMQWTAHPDLDLREFADELAASFELATRRAGEDRHSRSGQMP